MTTLAEHPSIDLVKMLNVGESKSGKTGQLVSLVLAGYTLWVLDYDSGLDILANLLRGNPEALSRVHYETLRDKTTIVGGVVKWKPPVLAFAKAGETLQKWGVESFGSNDIVVLDTLTTLSEAAFLAALSAVGRLNAQPQLQDYGWMADRVKLFIEMLTSPELKCNVIVNTHIRYLGVEEETIVGTAKDRVISTVTGLPNAKGQEISRTVSRYFNTVILTRSFGTGPATRRQISTQPQGVIEVATSNPKGVKPTYSIETGLAELFSDILGHGPTPAPSKTLAASTISKET